jgi:hypothetical protein
MRGLSTGLSCRVLAGGGGLSLFVQGINIGKLANALCLYPPRRLVVRYWGLRTHLPGDAQKDLVC